MWRTLAYPRPAWKVLEECGVPPHRVVERDPRNRGAAGVSILVMLARVAAVPVVAVAILAAGALAVVAWPHDPAPLVTAPHLAAPHRPFPTPDMAAWTPTPEEVADEGDGSPSRWLRECVDRGGHWCCGQGGCCGLRDTEIARGLFADLPMVSGPVPTPEIEAILNAQGARLRACRDREWLEETGFEYMFVRLVLPADGPVTVDIDGFDRGVASCFADVLRDAPFPRPATGAVTVRSSLSFR